MKITHFANIHGAMFVRDVDVSMLKSFLRYRDSFSALKEQLQITAVSIYLKGQEEYLQPSVLLALVNGDDTDQIAQLRVGWLLHRGSDLPSRGAFYGQCTIFAIPCAAQPPVCAL